MGKLNSGLRDLRVLRGEEEFAYLLLKAIHDVAGGREPPHIQREPSAAHVPKILVLSEVIPAEANPREYVKSLEARR